MPRKPQEEVKADCFPPDFRDILTLLHVHDVRYMIVGGGAIIFYGHARFTGDLDIFYEREAANTQRLYACLREFWQGDVPSVESAAELLKEHQVIQFGVPPNRLDLLNGIQGVEFAQAWPRRRIARCALPEREIVVNYLGPDDLIRNKTMVGRPKDKEDVRFLEKRKRD